MSFKIQRQTYCPGFGLSGAFRHHYAGGACKDWGATHRSGTVPPLWTFGRRVERTASQALLLCPPGNTASSSVKHILRNTLTVHVHTSRKHKMLTLLSARFGFVWPPPQVLLGSKCVSFSLLVFHRQTRCGVRRQCSLEKLFICNSYPERQGLVEAATTTIALIMRTMWINNGRDESNVESVKCLSFMLTFTNIQFILKPLISLLFYLGVRLQLCKEK